ncbi:hypothetical protein JT739_06595 [Tepidanaerobacter sp. GT38]|jgi:hypothetical protein|uniref:hypothetical protein n=1 Tax=Tepidanaerobacter sp. GT38 TaxID=2722793 RepID=UPI001F3B0B83|nr:hypothetical protein [Tepidanaerobacter sp. GT38]MCG1012265.1 hypothetical protein [Tepidanaerobacter sp. GT38]
MKKVTKEDLKKVAILAEEKGIIKPKSIIIPKNLKYDRITITKQRTWERLGIWLD